MYIFKKDESVVDITSVNIIWMVCAVSGANIREDALCQASTRPTNDHIQIFSRLEMDEWETVGLVSMGVLRLL
jgi:hypothetical protein